MGAVADTSQGPSWVGGLLSRVMLLRPLGQDRSFLAAMLLRQVDRSGRPTFLHL